MQPRNARISGNLTVFSTGPYMLRNITFMDVVLLFIIISKYY
jgi:hypothetical protein